MPIKRRKDPLFLASEFLLKFGDGRWLQVYLWQTQTGLMANTTGSYRGTVAMFCPHDDDEQPFLGELHFTLGRLTVGVVTHELLHALFHWCLVTKVNLTQMLSRDDAEVEETVCGQMELLVMQFWRQHYDGLEGARL